MREIFSVSKKKIWRIKFMRNIFRFTWEEKNGLMESKHKFGNFIDEQRLKRIQYLLMSIILRHIMFTTQTYFQHRHVIVKLQLWATLYLLKASNNYQKWLKASPNIKYKDSKQVFIHSNGTIVYFNIKSQLILSMQKMFGAVKRKNGKKNKTNIRKIRNQNKVNEANKQKKNNSRKKNDSNKYCYNNIIIIISSHCLSFNYNLCSLCWKIQNKNSKRN